MAGMMGKLAVPAHQGDHTRGAAEAPATLVMYGDYECPYARRAYRAVQKLLADEPDALRFVFRHFPLRGIHPHAQHASEAAEAAAARGGEEAFWRMHDALYHHQKALEDADLVRYAEEVGLDAGRFARELRAHAHADRIEEDMRSGRESGVHGTPTLYFNGQLHEGGYDEETLRATIARIVGGASPTS